MREPGQPNTIFDIDASRLEPIKLRHLLLRGACVGHRGPVVGLHRRVRNCHCENEDDDEMQIGKSEKAQRGCALLYEANRDQLADVFGRYYTLLNQRAHIFFSMRVGRTLYCGGLYRRLPDICSMLCYRRAGIVGPILRRLGQPHPGYIFECRGIAIRVWWDLYCGGSNRLILDINSHRVDTRCALSEIFQVRRSDILASS